MSVWSTWLTIEHPDQVAADLAAAGVRYIQLGDDSDRRALGSPYVYQESHVVPRPEHPRGGSVDVAVVPNFLHPDADPPGEDNRHRVEFVRLSVNEATVVLNRAQVVALRDVFADWLDEEERA